jgi:hypothetical protein
MDYPNMQQLTVKDPHYTKEEFSGMLSGEIVNPNNISFESVTVMILFKDKRGKLIGGESIPLLDSVKANENTYFNEAVLADISADDYEVYAMPSI